ncbi:hypothetical protein BJ741DRAFT_655494 [Chytriomyces cf. hyalinus JEL632]|nr:hypothetical protein BJ741DRAFT_655494 [Chytriomyces cf. hyalinus JEL632]
MSVAEDTLQTIRLNALPADARSVVMQLFNSSKDNVRIGLYKEIDGSLSLSPSTTFWRIIKNQCKNAVVQSQTIVSDGNYSLAIDFQMYNFPGKKATAVVKIDVALNIINSLSSQVAKAFRRANLNLFKRYLGGDKTLIPEIHAIDEAHLLNPNNGAHAFRGGVQHNQGWSQEFEERHRVIESTVYNNSQGGLYGFVFNHESETFAKVGTTSRPYKLRIREHASDYPNLRMFKFIPTPFGIHAEKLIFVSQLAATHQQSLVTPTGTKTTETILVSKHCTIHHLMDAMDLAVANASAPGNNLALEVEKTRQIEYQTKQVECVERTKQVELSSKLSDKLSAENLLKVLQFALPVSEPPTQKQHPCLNPFPCLNQQPCLCLIKRAYHHLALAKGLALMTRTGNHS